jgi:hypothetical protein
MLPLLIVLVGLSGLFLISTLRRRPAVTTAGDRGGAEALNPAGPSFVALAAARPRATDGEANAPRWLRASVRAERFTKPDASPRRTAYNASLLAATFSDPPIDSVTRMVLRYDRVAILDEPNEALARTLTEVRTGDEVDVLEVNDAWARVHTPRGLTGWLPTMTLARTDGSAAAERPEDDLEPASQDPSPPR